MIALRSYQKQAIRETLRFIQHKTGNGIIALPTGTGKSLIIAGLIRYYVLHKKQRVLVLTHVKELIEQDVRATESFCPQHSVRIGIYSAGLKKRQTKGDALFCGIASIHKRISEFHPFDLVLIDECHLVPDNKDTMYVSALNEIKKTNPNMRAIGLSATPYRLTSGLLTNGKIFDTVFYDKTSRDDFNWFVDNGYLASLITRETDQQLDVSKVHKRGGEFIPHELQLAVDKASITRAAIKEAIKLAENRKHWLVFSTGVEHNKNIVRELRRRGIAAASIDHKCTSVERDERIAAFKNGTLRAIVNANILTTGFDFHGIDLIVVLCPMCSPCKWVQSLGRGTRVDTDKPNCLVLDYAGNTRRLGPINDVVLPHNKKRGSGGGVAPIKKCPKCKTLVHISVKKCPTCDFVFPTATKMQEQADSADVVRSGKPAEDHWLCVDRVTYTKHIKQSTGSESLLITYFCAGTPFREWLSFNPHQYNRHKARVWWQARAMSNTPTSVDEALKRQGELSRPRKIVVVKPSNFFEIIKIKF